MFWRRDRNEQRTLTFSPWPLQASASVTPQGALGNPDVYAATRVLADAAASCPLIVYRRLGDGRTRASGSTAELLRAPAEGTTEAGFVSTLVAHLLLWGNAFLGKYRDQDGRVEQLLPIAPDRVTVERRAGRIVFKVADELGRVTEHGFDDLIHIKALSTDGLVGLSPIKQMRLALELNEATRSASTALFRNNARPSGILSIAGGSTRDQVESVKEQWQARHSGEAAGGIAVLSGDLSFTAVGMPAADAQFIEARKISATEVARAFRLPPWMIGAEGGDSMTYSNTESQALAFVVYSLRPWLTAIEQALTADRDLFSANLYAEFLLDSLLRGDSMTRAAVYEKALNPVTGWMTREEVRQRENLEPEPRATAPAPAAAGAMSVAIPTTNGASE
jgi:HK97 family phage portal protein